MLPEAVVCKLFVEVVASDAIFLKVVLDLQGGIESPKADRIDLDRAQPIIKSRVKHQALEVMDQEAQSPEESHVTMREPSLI